MMEKSILMPKLSPQMETGVLVSQLKKEGDPIQKGEAVFEVETDKVVSEVESTEDGIFVRYMFEEGDNVPVGEAVAVIKAAQ